MSISVAEEGNKRVGEMTQSELYQCILDIRQWFQKYKLKMLAKEATSADIQRIQKAMGCTLSQPLKVLLSECNGDIYLMDKKLLGTEGMLDVFMSIDSSKKWKKGFIPLCGDEMSLLVVDAVSGEIVEWESDDGFGDIISPNLVRFLEDYRNNLLSGHYEYLEGVGVIEKMSNQSTTKKSKGK